MFISVTFCILSFRTLLFIPQKKSASNFPLFYPLTTFHISQSTFRKIPLPISITNVCDIISKMSADELLLLSAAVSAAAISLVAFSCKTKTKHAKWLWMRPLFQRQHKYDVTWFNQTLSLAATLLTHEYLPTRLKACNYCMQGDECTLHCSPCGNWSALHAMNYRLFVPKTFRSQERKVPMENFRSPGTKVPGTFVPETFRSRELSFSGN